MIVLLCGPPGVGKTTIAVRLRERLEARGTAIGLLHSDDFARRTYERMYERVKREGGDWLLDGTFYEREWRERFRGLDEVCVVHVTASLESCLERNRERPDPISETGVHVIHREFETPRADLTIDTDELSVEEAVDRAEKEVEKRR
ncbi:AAA family ATPase [Halalkalicoccus salilacus]|uniref:AAA family ATPase n=1 Tax=Halalkalicoccus salilacus TaxID=3117459 RepID=UPI00300E8696